MPREVQAVSKCLANSLPLSVCISVTGKGQTVMTLERKSAALPITAPKTMIDARPKVIDKRERLGDFEGDTVLLNGLERLYTLVDRKSGYLFLRHIQNGEAETLYQETLKNTKNIVMRYYLLLMTTDLSFLITT